jgi:hypothetical protein
VIPAPEYRRVPGLHSLVGAIIRQAVLDCKSEYQERSNEYPAYRFLYDAGLLSRVDSLHAAILSSDPSVYHEARKDSA